MIVSVAFALDAATVPVMVAAVEAVTGLVVIVNVPVEKPAATVTVDGTVAVELLDVNATVVPPVGAMPLRVTVPVEVEPPRTEVGATVSDVIVRLDTVTVRVCVNVTLL